MASKTEFFLLLFLTSFLLFRASDCYQYDENPSIEDLRKQYEWCQRECDLYKEKGQSELKKYCQDMCRERYEEQKERQEQGEQRGGSGTIGAVQNYNYPDQAPEKKYRQCQQKCGFRKEGEERERCKQECLEEYSKKRGREGHGRGEELGEEEYQEGRGAEGEKQQGEKNPYFFEGQRFKSKFRTEAGEFKVLERFTKRSELLKGIENYRLAILEADPNTFVLPHHSDSEVVLFVTRGEGTITFVHQERRESFNLERGDAIKVPAGSTVYLINRHNNEKLQIFKLIHPINTPGHFEGFFGSGGQEPQSFYRVFSNELLEAAFNTPRDKLERLFGQHKKGIIVRARPEQIKALSQHAEGSTRRFKGQPRGPFNLLSQRPSFCNNYGQFFEATPHDNEQLKDIDVSVAVMNINPGAMVAPYYNSRSTKLVLVTQGSGYFELACPHLPRQSQQGSRGTREREQPQQQQQRGIHYQKASARFSVGDVFIIPVGHPISIVSSGNQKLQLVGFGVNAKNNQKHFLAGQDNIWKQVESEAKELAFEVPAREVEQVFRSQELSYFVPGPGQQQQRGEGGRDDHVPSILDFFGFI